jgi:hypothetical protein
MLLSLMMIHPNDCNRAENGQHLLRATNPPDLAHSQLRDLVYPDSDGVVEDCEEEDAVDDDGEDYQQQDMNLKQALEAETLEQDHEALSIVNLIDVANNMAGEAGHEQLTSEGNGGGMEEEERNSAESEADNIIVVGKKLENECPVIQQQLKKIQE